MNDKSLDGRELFKSFPIRERKKEVKIGVIAGGISPEREVSLSTGKGIFKALCSLGYNADFIDFKKDILNLLNGVDIVFIALHGKFGEDGTVQGMLELLKIPYTGSGVLSSAAAMDKIFSKKIFKFEGIKTPSFMEFNLEDFNRGLDYSEIDTYLKKNIGYPVIVKPNKGGSSIGVTITDSKDMLCQAVKTAFNYDEKILVEKYLTGKLLTVSIIGDRPVALPVIEIRPKSGFYDYKSKYTQGYTDYILPARIDDKYYEKIQSIALRCHEALNCAGISRVDLILTDGKHPEINVLEVNTIPGMTATSLVPKAAAALKINFELLVEIILNSASLKL